MTKRELIEKTLAGVPTGRVAVSPLVCGAARGLVGASYKEWSTDASLCGESFVRAAELLDMDCITLLVDLSVECAAWGQSVVFPENEAARPDYSEKIIKTPEDYAKIKRADWKSSGRMRFYADLCGYVVKKIGGSVPTFAFVFGPLGTLSMCRGQEDLFMDMYDCPEKVKAASHEIALTLAEYAGALCDTGVDGVMLDTLFASGSIMSKEMWEDAEGGDALLIARAIREKGKKVLVHNCGKRVYFDSQIKYMNPDAISFLYPPDDCGGFDECREKYGGSVTLIGCVPPTYAVMGSDKEWSEICRSQIKSLSGGRFILSTGCEYPAGADLNRAKLMVDAARRT